MRSVLFMPSPLQVAASLSGAIVGYVPSRIHDAVASTVKSYAEIASPRSPAYGGFVSSASAALVPVLDVRINGAEPPLRSALRGFSPQVYVFNVTNAADVLAKGAAPVVALVGPVSFAERWEQQAPPTWILGGDVISYLPELTLDLCGGGSAVCEGSPSAPLLPSAPATLETRVWAASLPFLLADANELWDVVPGGRAGASPLAEVSVGDLLFGYADPIYAAVHEALPDAFPPSFPGLLRNASPYMHWPEHAANASSAGAMVDVDSSGRAWDWRMWTGLGGAGGQREYLSVSGMATLEACSAGPCDGGALGRPSAHPAWGSAGANAIFGWDWLQFSTALGEDARVDVFDSRLLRSISVVADPGGARVTHRGIPSQRFHISGDAYEPASSIPSNAAYHQFGPPGLFNLSTFAARQPLFESQPLFAACGAEAGSTAANASAALRAAVGLPPTLPPDAADSLCTWVDVEPRTGMTVGVGRRSQLAVAVPLPAADSVGPLLPGTLLPVLWHDRRGEVTPAAASAFDRAVTRLDSLAGTVWTAFIAAFSASVALAVGCWLWGCRTRKHARLERLEEGAGRRMAGLLAAAALRSVSAGRLEEGGGAAAGAAGAGGSAASGLSGRDSPAALLRPLLQTGGKAKAEAGEGRVGAGPAAGWEPPEQGEEEEGGEQPALGLDLFLPEQEQATGSAGGAAMPPPAAPHAPLPEPVRGRGAAEGARPVAPQPAPAAAATYYRFFDDGEGGGWPGPALDELGGGDEWGPEQAAAAEAPLYWGSAEGGSAERAGMLPPGGGAWGIQ